jgi:hypothetical protein
MSDIVENTPLDAFGGPGSRPVLPPPDFDFLIYSLRLQAEMSLGLLPFADKDEPDFELARHNIDLLAMLQEKTRGNLTAEEQLALDNSLTELRYRYVQAKESAPGD